MSGKWSRALVVVMTLCVVGAAAWQAPIACAWVPSTDPNDPPPPPPPPPPPDPGPLPDPEPIDPPPTPPPSCHHSPEPSTMVLAGLGAAALATGALRRRKAK